jgi:hypothetical protein
MKLYLFFCLKCSPDLSDASFCRFMGEGRACKTFLAAGGSSIATEKAASRLQAWPKSCSVAAAVFTDPPAASSHGRCSSSFLDCWPLPTSPAEQSIGHSGNRKIKRIICTLEEQRGESEKLLLAAQIDGDLRRGQQGGHRGEQKCCGATRPLEHLPKCTHQH